MRTYQVKKIGAVCYFICMTILMFTVYSGKLNNAAIDIPHLTVSFLPLYAVIAVIVLSFCFIGIQKPMVFDGVAKLLFFRVILPFIPILYIKPGPDFAVNFATSAICLLIYLIAENGINDWNYVVKITKIILLVMCAQTIAESFLGTNTFWGNTYYYKNDLILPIGGSNAIAAKVIPCFSFVFCTEENGKKKIFYTVIAAIAVVLTKSRSGLIVFAFMLALLWALNAKKENNRAIKIIIALFIVVICFNWFISDTSIGQYAFSSSDSTVNGRLARWAAGIDQFLQHPIAGNGFSDAVTNPSADPHNFFIYILMRSGILGIIVLFCLVSCFIKRSKGFRNDAFVKGCICFGICMVLQSLGEVIILSYNHDIMLWFMMGCMMNRIYSIDDGEIYYG